ncbi:Pkinase-domain-containing protein [Dacryopinax primogenitus]|uniref:non-specific serine/threonine protein kinase n=1 Tax=Dacryopinax primogenitus (strain DJM 731) TaxID=1858805 RepID=M5FSQ9_DACPD|nr:Pkinase-domain-containing protein [Dacryopinax primogenitus]EJU00526.1 Pkinase-domain-containing protein [Dacryopinax primogenitus]
MTAPTQHQQTLASSSSYNVKDDATPIIGQYKVLENIGEGSFGKVKLAVHTVTGQKVAMKIINRQMIAQMEMGGRVKREIDYLRMLRHPHIIKLYEVITTPTDIIMVIEYAADELFNYIVAHGPLPLNAARRFFQQLICAIEYCHKHKIVHRDLKPENLLLDSGLNIKIGDFGLSNAVNDGEFLKTSCGSPNYAAPEVISGKLYAGPEIDVWSCGVILYVMLCGRLPFDDDYIPTLFKKINGGLYHLPAHLDPQTRQLLQSMLVVDSMKRITIPQIRALPWFNVDLPEYLKPQSPVVGTLSSLVSSNKGKIRGLGVVDEEIVDNLAEKLKVRKKDIWNALKMDQDNGIKVAYMLDRDKRRMNQPYELEEDDDTPMEWAHILTPSRRQDNPPSDDEDEDDDEFDDWNDEEADHNFSVLESSMPIAPEGGNGIQPEISIELNSVNAAQKVAQSVFNNGSSNGVGAVPMKKNQKPKWHFGIRSRSPPGEVMLEIYGTLQALGMQWKSRREYSDDKDAKDKSKEKRKERDVDLYFVETRWRMKDVVVRMDLQLYQVDQSNYLVDFRNVGYYRAPQDDPETFVPAPPPSAESPNSNGLPGDASPNDLRKVSGDVSSPFLFLECACRLIVELAGGA